MSRKPIIFISYANEDKRRVTALYKKLEQAGYKPWMDKKNILGGSDWKGSIKRAIQNSDVFVYCLSHQSVNKRGVLVQELNMAREVESNLLSSDIFIIPLKLDDCQVPDDLSHKQYIDYYASGGWEKFEEAIKASYRVKKNNLVANKNGKIAAATKTSSSKESIRALSENPIDAFKSSRQVPSDTLSQDGSVSKYFVGRGEALKEFYSIFSYRRQKNIIYYEADGGLGKSWLIKKIYEGNISNPGYRIIIKPINFADIKNRTVSGVKELIINSLGKKHFSQYYRFLEDQLNAENADIATSIIVAKREKAEYEFFENLNNASAHREIVFLFDTFEIIQNTELGRWFVNDFLLRAENLIIIFAGRTTNPALELPFKAIKVKLSPFNYDEAEEFFKINSVRFKYNPDLINRKSIEKLCDQPGIDGLPLRLELALNYLTTPGNPGLESIISENLSHREVEEKLIHFIRTEVEPINPVLRDMAILKRRYDREIINFLMKNEELYEYSSSKQILRDLNKHFIVKTNPDGSYALHDQIQVLVEEYVLTKPKFGDTDIIGRQLFDAVVGTWYSAKIETTKSSSNLHDLLLTEQLGYKLDRVDNDDGIEEYKKYFEFVKSRNSFSFNELLINELLLHRNDLDGKGYKYLREQAEWLYSKSHYAQAANIFKVLVQEHSEEELRFDNLAYWGSCLLSEGRYFEALETLAPAYQTAASVGNIKWLGRLENYYAYIYQVLGKWDDAKKAYKDALEYARKSDDIALECRVLIQFSEFQALLGDYEESIGYCDSALNLINNRNLGDQSKGEAYLAFAKIKRYQGNFPEAEKYYEEALRIFKLKKSGMDWICNTLQSLGANYILSGQILRKLPTLRNIKESLSFQIKAYEVLNESLGICREFSLSPYLPECLYRLGRVIAEFSELDYKLRSYKPFDQKETQELQGLQKVTNNAINKILKEIDLPEESYWRVRRKLVFGIPLRDIKQEKNLLGLAQRFSEVGYLIADAEERVHASLESLIESTRFALRRRKYEEVVKYAERVEFSKGYDYQEGLFVALVNIILGDLLFEKEDYFSALKKYKEYFPLLVRQKGYGFYRFDRQYESLSNRINIASRKSTINWYDWCKELLDSWVVQGMEDIYPAITIKLSGLMNSFKKK